MFLRALKVLETCPVVTEEVRLIRQSLGHAASRQPEKFYLKSVFYITVPVENHTL